MPVVAMAREIGTGVNEVAQQVARAIGAEVLDRRIIDEVARRLRIPADQVEELDERAESLLERLFSGMAAGDAGIGDAWTWSPPYPSDPAFNVHRASRRVTEEVIREAARLGDVVIVGRGSAYLLKDHPGVLRVFLRAPREARIEGVMARMRIGEKAAAERVKESDANWGAYVRDAYKVDWRDPSNYDLVVDTSHFGTEGTASVIVAAVTSITER